MSAAARLANAAWLASNAGGWVAFERALRDVRGAQERILLRILRRHAGTRFGSRHGFASIRSAEQYARAVPLSTWDDYADPIEAIRRGRAGVLTRDRVKLLEPTSGTTAAVKLVPWTTPLQREFRRAIAPWIFDLCRHDPGLLGGPAYWSITPALPLPPAEPGGPSIGFDHDAAYLGGPLRRVVDAAMAVPAGVARLADVDAFRRATLLCLLRCGQLRLISVWHPSFLTLLMEPLARLWGELLEAIARGGPIEGTGLTLPPDRRRARELQRAVPGDTAALWPRLGLVSCWGDAHAALGVGEVAARFPHARVQPKGLIATEAIVSLPYGDSFPLAVTSHFLELVDDAGGARPAWEAEPGAVYSVVVTTSGGLYRYRLSDRVLVTGRLHQAPCVRFLGKEGHVSDRRGEKLGEGFAGETIRELLTGVGSRARFAMLAPEASGSRVGYVLFLETDAEMPPGLSSSLESALCRNPHYRACARLGQLAPARVARVAPGAYERYVRRLISLGRRLGGIKPSPLSPLEGWARTFEAVLDPEADPVRSRGCSSVPPGTAPSRPRAASDVPA